MERVHVSVFQAHAPCKHVAAVAIVAPPQRRRCGGRGAREEGQGHAENEKLPRVLAEMTSARRFFERSRSMPARASSPARPIATLRCAIGGR